MPAAETPASPETETEAGELAPMCPETAKLEGTGWGRKVGRPGLMTGATLPPPGSSSPLPGTAGLHCGVWGHTSSTQDRVR